MRAKKLISILAAVVMITSAFTPVYGHSSSVAGLFDGQTVGGNYYVGNETIGWSIDEAYHTNSTSITYKFDSSVGVALKSVVYNAATKWQSPFSVSENTSAIGTIAVASLYSNVVAAFCEYSANSSGHLTTWKIKINSAYVDTIGATTIAHEFGHVYGLNDLYNSSNRNKLMYGYETRTVVKPQTADKWGAKVITGNHASHSWEYVYYAANKHRKTCTSCGGFKTEGCTPNSNGYCTKCGHYVGISPDGIFEPTAALLPNTDEERKLKLLLLI